MSQPDAESAPRSEDVAARWSTALTEVRPGVIHVSGYPIEQLIGRVSFSAMIWLMMRGELPTASQAQLLERALVAAVDHGPQALSIAAARMAATCGVGINNAVATGVNLLGDVHGGAGQQCMELLRTVRAKTGAAKCTTAEAVTEIIADYRVNRRFLPGFGHRFQPRDPRRDPLLAAVQEFVQAGQADGGYLSAAVEIETQLAAGQGRPVPMNIDGATAVIYSELGFDPVLGRGLFVLSRSVGILADAWEEQQQGSRLKGPMPPPLVPAYRGREQRPLPCLAVADDQRCGQLPSQQATPCPPT
jgi:citrate synthase